MPAVATVTFDPSRPDVSLKEPSLRWSQRNAPPFVGVADSGYRNDGERCRATPNSAAVWW